MRTLFKIILLTFFISCNRVDKPKKPSNLIPKDKMVTVMHDLYILNAAKGVNKTILELNGVQPLAYVFKKYDIDSLQFAQSNTYYAYDLEAYKAIVEKVKLKLQEEKDLYDLDKPERIPLKKNEQFEESAIKNENVSVKSAKDSL